MSFEGIVQNGVVVLESGQSLPEGTRVEVLVKAEVAVESAEPTLGALLRYAGVIKDLPTDMARNHDHYLHGAPKR